MPSKFPPQFSTRTTVALATVALFTFLYSIVVAGQILLWFVLAGIAIGLYLTYLLIVAVFRLVEAVERIATAAEVDTGIRDASDVDPETADREIGGPGVGTDGPVDAEGTDDSAGVKSTDAPDDDGAEADGTADPVDDAGDASSAVGQSDADDADPGPDADPDRN